MSEQYLNKYLVEERIGTGAFATVYRCYDPDLDTTCAIKVLAENWTEESSAREWFLNEARVMFGIDHPSIIRVFTSGTLDDGRPYFVMEFADRGSLADLIRSRNERGSGIRIAEALDISIGIANGLAVAHARGLVHRDLKPSNVLFRSGNGDAGISVLGAGSNLQVKLADFGLVRRAEQGASSLAGAGTPHYIAPEQAEGAADDPPDVRSDIYSAATVLYELLTGRVPFPYRSMSQVINAHLHEDPPPVQSLAPHVPNEVADIVHAGMEKDPDLRVQTAVSWRNQLQVLKTALNADGTISGWHDLDREPSEREIDFPPIPLAPDPMSSGMDYAAAESSAPTLLPDTRVLSSDRSSDDSKGRRARADRVNRANPFVPYVFAAVAAGLLVIALLGYALSELVIGDENGDADADDTAGVVDDFSSDDEEQVIVPTPTPTIELEVPSPTATPEPESDDSDPEPTPTPESEPTPEPDPAADDVVRVLQELPGQASSVVILPSGARVAEAADSQSPAGSTITLWVAATVLDEVASGNLELDDGHIISTEDQVSGTGILSASRYLGDELTIGELVEIMLLYSDNSATNILVEKVGGMETINDYIERHGYEQTLMQRRLGFLDPDRENYTSAFDGALFMERLLNDEIVDEDSSGYLRTILEARAEDDGGSMDFFGRHFSEDVPYAHMSGLIPRVRNEFGYFYSAERDGYVIVSVTLQGLDDEAGGEDALARSVEEIREILGENHSP